MDSAYLKTHNKTSSTSF